MNEKRALGKLERSLRQDVDIRGTNLEYGKQSKVIGEIDYYMYRKGAVENVLWIFEYKSSHRSKLRGKAIGQLHRAKKRFVPYFKQMYGVKVDRVHLYYVAPKNRDRDLFMELIK